MIVHCIVLVSFTSFLYHSHRPHRSHIVLTSFSHRSCIVPLHYVHTSVGHCDCVVSTLYKCKSMFFLTKCLTVFLTFFTANQIHNPFLSPHAGFNLIDLLSNMTLLI